MTSEKSQEENSRGVTEWAEEIQHFLENEYHPKTMPTTWELIEMITGYDTLIGESREESVSAMLGVLDSAFNGGRE